MIPSSLHQAVRAYVQLDGGQRRSLKEFLQVIEVGKEPKDLSVECAAKLGIEENEAFDVLVLVFTLTSIDVDSSGDLSRFLEDVNSAIAELVSDERKCLAAQKDLERLAQISAPLRTTAKGHQLAVESERCLSSSRVLTDIRPVFGPGDNDTEIQAALVLHQLRVDYFSRSSRATQTICIDLSLEDLLQLKRQIARAQKKDAVLKKLLSNQEVKLIEHE